MGYLETITYNSGAALNYSNLVTISGGALTLAGSSPFPTSNPVVTSQHQNTITALTSFAETSTLASGTSVTYQITLGGNPYWYNATLASWQAADGTFATSNTPAVINTNASTLISSLNILTNQFLGLRIFLNTTNTANAPVLNTNTIGYTWVNSNATAINQCVISTYLKNLVGAVPLPTVLTPAQLLVSSPYGFFHGTNFVEPFTKAFSFSTMDGSLSASVIETATPGVQLKFSLTYWDGSSVKNTFLFNAIVPNQSSISLSNLSSPIAYDFG
jgi:hypothetical protein